jgi:hypothetical protein
MMIADRLRALRDQRDYSALIPHEFLSRPQTLLLPLESSSRFPDLFQFTSQAV